MGARINEWAQQWGGSVVLVTSLLLLPVVMEFLVYRVRILNNPSIRRVTRFFGGGGI